ETDYQVMGVFEDIPHNSHIKFDILLSFKNMGLLFDKAILSDWKFMGNYTYLRMKPGVDPGALEKKLARLVRNECGEEIKKLKLRLELLMQPMADIHLTSHYVREIEINGNRDSVNILFIIAFFTIIPAWVNYTNLSTVYFLTRWKEVALRKVMGASRKQLMVRFLMEAIIINAGSVFVALALVELALPYFSGIVGVPMTYSIWWRPWFQPVVAGMLIVGVFLAGLYPVLVMTSFKSTGIIKNPPGINAKGLNLRKSLVVFQFVVAQVLLTGTFFIYNQLDFMKSRDTGLNMDQVLVIKSPIMRKKNSNLVFTTFKETLRAHTHVKKVCISSEVPGRQIIMKGGSFQIDGKSAYNGKAYYFIFTDYDYVDFFDLELAAGRNFSTEFPTDESALILNETAAEFMGFESAGDAVGKEVVYWGDSLVVVGVLKDFHQQSVREHVEPHVFLPAPPRVLSRMMISVKIATTVVNQTVTQVKALYEKLFPDSSFDYFFLDEYYNRQYQGEELLGKVIGFFAFLSLIITCMGIFGLWSFIAMQRTKEIGIRKVLGAGVPGMLVLLMREFLVLLGISFAISLPFCLYGINHRLESFAMQMDPGLWIFLVPLWLVAVITMLTITYHVIKTSLADPVKSLRYE
ncbi:MAG: hypothetical protein GY765_28380, partial [bacterium]|nr:hypothetical protein [bacterium]